MFAPLTNMPGVEGDYPVGGGERIGSSVLLPKTKLQSNTLQWVSPTQWRVIEAGISGVTGIWGWERKHESRQADNAAR